MTNTEKCDCFHIEHSTPCCWGTKEREQCSCGGDRCKCDQYPEIKEKALKEVGADNACDDWKTTGTVLRVFFGERISNQDLDKIFEYLDDNVTDEYVAFANSACRVNNSERSSAIRQMIYDSACPVKGVLSEDMLEKLICYLSETSAKTAIV